MPTYEYRCNKCGEHFELFQSFQDEPLKKHPGRCGGKVLKVLSPAGIVFSGSGFYKTDNRAGRSGGNGRKADGGEKSGASEPSGGSEKSGSSDTASASEKSASSEKSSGTASKKSA